jgi:hypothetical protein
MRGTAYLEGKRKITENLRQDSRSPGRDLNLAALEYEERVAYYWPDRDVLSFDFLLSGSYSDISLC